MLESDLINATYWLEENKLHLNVSKTKWTFFSTQTRLHGVMYPLVTVNGQELERVNQYKYMGVFVDTCFDWNYHIGVTADNLVCLEELEGTWYLTQKRCYITHLCDYCDVVICNLNKTNIRRLQKLQNRVGRIIVMADSRTHINDMMSDLKWLTK